MRKLNKLKKAIEKVAGRDSDITILGEFRGRKIIPKTHWYKIAYIGGKINPELEKYMPDVYDWGCSHLILQNNSEWEKDFIDYHEQRKDEQLGKTKCWGCIMHGSNPDKYMSSASQQMVRDTLGFNEPCRLENYWQCPYDQNPLLFHAYAIEQVLSTATYRFTQGEHGNDGWLSRNPQPDEFHCRMARDPMFYKKFVLEHPKEILEHVPDNYKEAVKAFLNFIQEDGGN